MAYRRRKLSEREDGFTLVELVVAMFVLAIVILAILTVQARALVTNADSQIRQGATAYANEAMEELRAMPWNILRKGLASNFKTAAGGDSFVAGSVLTVNGVNYALRVAPSGAGDQVLASPWKPLFDTTGSNKQVRTDPSGNGATYTVRAYTVSDPAGNTDAVGLVTVVTWQKRTNGEFENTVLTSTAYAPSGGCGDLNNAPFLASCQAQLYAMSSGGNVVITVGASATTVSGGAVVPTSTQAPLLPNASAYSLQMATAQSGARVANQQVSNVDAYATAGGVVLDDLDPNTQPEALGWLKGLDSATLRASNDLVAGAPPANPADISPASAVTTTSLSSGSGLSMQLAARADDTRSGVADASTTTACATGITAATIPAGSPCSHTVFGNSTATTGYAILTIDGTDLQLGRVLHGAGNASADHAWSGRFSTTAGTANTGCTTVSGAGCVSAGANRTAGEINIGSVTGGWTGGKAANGIVRITGYTDSVMAQRGVNQKNTAASLTRTGTVSYWNGSTYANVALGAGTSAGYTTGTVEWESANIKVTATGRVTITPSQQASVYTDATCKNTACEVNASNGNITVAIQYLITPKSGAVDPFVISVTTQINGSSAAATFTESPNA